MALRLGSPGMSVANLRLLLRVFSSDMAIDLGTTSTRIFAKGRGIVVDEPSAVAINTDTGEVEAVGREAKEMLGRTPGKIVVIKPMKEGVIADFKVTETMRNYFIQKAHQRKLLMRPRIIYCVPSDITAGVKHPHLSPVYRSCARYS